ncbi:hypothetical protein HY477_01430 [Candidatus Uhrbacteria bacterium]|nr:hypothetical protein [Candidatus Uhrbacteria bacterium]
MRQEKKPRRPSAVADSILQEILNLPPASQRRVVEAWQSFFAEEDDLLSRPENPRKKEALDLFKKEHASDTGKPTPAARESSPSSRRIREDVPAADVDERMMWELTRAEQRMVIHVAAKFMLRQRDPAYCAQRRARAKRLLAALFEPPLGLSD